MQNNIEIIRDYWSNKSLSKRKAYINQYQFSLNDKIWLYVYPRFLSKKEIDIIEERLEEFVKSWQAHGNQINGTFLVIHNIFVVLFAKKAAISGCSIDKSVNTLKDLEIDINPLNRMLVHYSNELGEIKVIERSLVKEKIFSKEIKANTIIFDISKQTIKDYLEGNWCLFAKNSWVNDLF